MQNENSKTTKTYYQNNPNSPSEKAAEDIFPTRKENRENLTHSQDVLTDEHPAFEADKEFSKYLNRAGESKPTGRPSRWSCFFIGYFCATIIHIITCVSPHQAIDNLNKWATFYAN